jgi:hypothetical protein
MTDPRQALDADEAARFASAQAKFSAALLLAVLSTIAAFAVLLATGWGREAGLALLAAGWAPFYFVRFFVRRCPRCGKGAGNRPVVEFCPHCGVRFAGAPRD